MSAAQKQASHARATSSGEDAHFRHGRGIAVRRAAEVYLGLQDSHADMLHT